MDLPPWVSDIIRQFTPPETGEVVIVLERYKGGVTKMKIGGQIRHKPPENKSGDSVIDAASGMRGTLTNIPPDYGHR